MKTTVKNITKNKGVNTSVKKKFNNSYKKELIIWAPYYPYPMSGFRVGNEGLNMGKVTPLLLYFILISDLYFENLFFSSVEEKIYIDGYTVFCSLLTNNIENWLLPDEEYVKDDDNEDSFFSVLKVITERQNDITDKLDSSPIAKEYKRLRNYYIEKAENKELGPLLKTSIYDKIIFKILFHGDILFVEGKNMSFSECEKIMQKLAWEPSIKYKKFARVNLYTSKGLKNFLIFKVKHKVS